MNARTALVVNCSASHYNLGAAKLADWLRSEGYEVETAKGDPGMFAYGYDLVCLSVIFSWHAPLAAEIALRVKGTSEVWAGGPGLFKVGKWFEAETGVRAAHALDKRFDKQRGQYRATFASRGCPVGCSFCIVPGLEGRKFTLDWEFQPAPLLYDNNLSALPVDFQEHIVSRYAHKDAELIQKFRPWAKDVRPSLLDANSGFEPRTFDEDTYERWRYVLRGAWRFALDDCDELAEVESMMRVLKDVPASRKRVYVLIGNEPIERCHERALRVIEWGGEPFCQPVLPLDWMKDPRRDELPAAFNWTSGLLKDFCRYYNRWLWRSMSLEEYKPRIGEPPPFNALALRTAA
jgi:pyruvate-formate lyase-activating enzyme